MVLEALFNPFQLKKKPWQMFAAGMLYSIFGLLIAYFVFREAAGLLMIFLIVAGALPVIYVTIKQEEEIDLKYDKEWKLLKEHTKVIIFLIFLFLGITAGLTLLYVFLPGPVTDSVFSLQQKATLDVSNNVQASLVGNITRLGLFKNIFLNNAKVLFFCLIFSFLYGTGAIFILTWNASVVAAATGNLIKEKLGAATAAVGYSTISTYFAASAHGFFRYMTHGIIEIAAYFIAGLAGGIISIALIKHNLEKDTVLIDAIDLILISVGLLFFGSFVEVYITPLLFI